MQMLGLYEPHFGPLAERITGIFFSAANEFLPYLGLVVGALLGAFVVMHLLGFNKDPLDEPSAFEKALVAGHNAEEDEWREDHGFDPFNEDEDE